MKQMVYGKKYFYWVTDTLISGLVTQHYKVKTFLKQVFTSKCLFVQTKHKSAKPIILYNNWHKTKTTWDFKNITTDIIYTTYKTWENSWLLVYYSYYYKIYSFICYSYIIQRQYRVFSNNSKQIQKDAVHAATNSALTFQQLWAGSHGANHVVLMCGNYWMSLNRLTNDHQTLRANINVNQICHHLKLWTLNFLYLF